MVGFVKFIAVAIFVGCSFCFAQKSIAQKQSEWFSEFATADSLNAPLLIGTVKKETSPTIDEKYFVYNPPENEFRDEKPERPKTIPAGFHNPTILIGSEDRTNVNEAMSKVGKGLCYGSIAAMILSGGNIPVLCEQHGLH